MKSIEYLSQFLEVIGWLVLLYTVLNFFQVGLGHNLSWLLIFVTVQQIAASGVYIGLAHGLDKKEKWAFYVGLAVFIINILVITIKGILTGFSNVILPSILIDIIFIGLLFSGKQLFIEQPKEKVSQWIRKPYFIIVVAGFIISSLIYIGVSFYFNSKKQA